MAAPVLLCVLVTSCAAPADDAAPADLSVHDSRALPVQPSNQVQRLEVWIDLSVPALSTLPGRDRERRDALRARIRKQQDEVMAHLAPLGAEELARVVQVRNAIAVRIATSQLPRARTIPGVVNVRVVKHRRRTP